MSCEAYVDLRHLHRIADDVDSLSACVLQVAIKEIEHKRKYVKDTRALLGAITRNSTIPIDIRNLTEELLMR